MSDRTAAPATLMVMRTVLLGEPPPPLQSWLDRRRALGQDRYDEMWEGEYHVAPAASPEHGDLDDQLARILGPAADLAGLRGSGPLNVGTSDDYRVPDRAYLAERARTTFVPTAVIVVEILSPNDETWQKLGFYAAHDVEELLVVNPRERSVRWFRRDGDAFRAASASRRLTLSSDELAAALDWPPLG